MGDSTPATLPRLRRLPPHRGQHHERLVGAHDDEAGRLGRRHRARHVGWPLDAGAVGAVIDLAKDACPAVRSGIKGGDEAGGQLNGGRLGHLGQ
jgi:hypothetical protein